MTVTLFIPCFVDALYPRAGISMVEILERLGHNVVCPEEIACCGQPPFNSGYWDEARAIAAKVLEKLAGCGGRRHRLRLVRRDGEKVLSRTVRQHAARGTGETSRGAHAGNFPIFS